MNLLRLTAVLILSGTLASLESRAQATVPLSDRAQASLVTILPGEPVYTVFGHSALRITDPASETDLSFNYGTFEFDATFVPKFVRGQLDYYLSVSATGRAAQQYQAENRMIIEQKLDLEPADVSLLYQRLVDNARLENAFYRYDFFFDNCSTRILDIIDDIFGARVSTNVPDFAPESFRELLDPYLNATPLLDLGIDLVLGVDADEIATYRQRSFLPIELMGHFDQLRLDGRQLVLRTDTLWVAEPSSDRLTTSWLTIALWVVFLFAVVQIYRQWRAGSEPRPLVDAALFGLVGVAGVVFVLMWLATDHVVTDKNWNLAWAWPTHVLAAIGLLTKRWSNWASRYFAAYVVVILCLAAGWFVWPQELPTAFLPFVLLLGLRAMRLVIADHPRPSRERVHDVTST